MANITVYQKPTCSTCRQTIQILKDEGVEFTSVNYYDTPFTAAQLKDLLKRAGLKPREAIRTKEEIYKRLKLAEKQLSDDDLIEVMVKNPDLIQRPFVQKAGQVVLARPAETVKDLL